MSKELNKATVEQAGTNVGHGHVFPRADGVKMRCGGPGLCSECSADASRARAALAQPSLMPPDRGPWHAVKWDGGRRVDLSSDDFEHDVALTVSGDFVEGDKFRYAQELAAWMNAHLAQPSPVQAEQHWPKLEKPAQVGGVRFSAGVSSRLVVEAAQRLYEFESTPEKEAERIERLQAFREQLDPLNLASHAKAFNEAPAEALKPEPAEAERPEVVATMYTHHDDVDFREFVVVGNCDKGCEGFYGPEKLMTVAQHERIVGELRAVIAQLRQHKNDYMDSGQETYRALQNEIREREAEIARLDGLVSGRTAERDAALAKVAELTATRNRYGVDAHYFNKNLQRILRDFESFTPDELARSLIILAKVADEKVVAQAQHSVPEEFIGRLSEFLAQRGATGKALLRELRTVLAAAPGTEVPQAWLDVQAERRRQITAEGWTPEHDDAHSHGQMARAAACYALAGSSAPNDGTAALLVSLAWPWDEQWWKPTTTRRDLVKACALGLAEIERLDRAAAPGKEEA